MMRKILGFLLAPVLAGCLTSTPPEVAHWVVDYDGRVEAAKTAKYGVARLTQVQVRAPYNRDDLVVMCADGTVAFDPCNSFAAAPPQLVKWVAFDALSASGLFDRVVGSSSGARTPVSVEVVLNRLALDCRQEGERIAVAAALVRILRDGAVVAVAKGAGTADAKAGDYGKAFSSAISESINAALKQLR